MATVRVEAENYKPGQLGVTYYDTTSQNIPGYYRPNEGVDIAPGGNTSNGHLVGWTDDGEWLTYDIQIPETGTYNLVARVASALENTSMQLGVSVDGGQQRTLQFSGKGDWVNWQDIRTENLSLTAGQHTLRLDILKGGYNLDYIELVSVNTSSPSPQPSPQPSVPQLGNIINGFTGSNNYTGGDGIDTISYTQARGGIVANLATGVVTHKFTTIPERPIKIMPTGDSNTFGLANLGDDGAYRDDLWRLLRNNGYNIDFVGPQSSGSGDFDKDHAGYPGWKTTDTAVSINGWLNTYQPDMVLLMTGTNDFRFTTNTSEVAQRLSSLIDQITNQAPNTQVLVASIPPIATLNKENRPELTQLVADFNSRIPSIVNSKASQGRKVSFVDVFNSINESDLVYGDGVHPTMAGYSKIARTWYDAILSANSSTDRLQKIENIIGSSFDDVLAGDERDNIINGSAGNDTVTGNGGRDTFVIAVGQGTDTITDFIVSQDWIGLANGLSFDQLSITQGTGTNINNTLISYINTPLAILNGVQASTITNQAFISV
ncbi:GDSL-type esterase/lipase family protein [Iningainema tapete]|uniref:Carbohydrate-binding protein n=1 Tax=Iningainema tapete BLCC-T55 TaxID=2748662 RepID=A0A8J6Y187_9CYAN|nr:GDSL-type esterase/lipase family protein [Iningainema tapete]MBD2777358.1 carbohydrate-binding protein [Iningainema tapete BLCC-T55]